MRRSNATTRSVNATWGIYIKSLETAEEIALHADRQMETMSTIKIPLMVGGVRADQGRKVRARPTSTRFAQADSSPARA